MKRIVSLLAASLLMVSAFTGCGSDKNVLKVATNAEFPPWESLNDSKEVIGIDADIINAVAEKLGMKVEFKNMEFDGVVSAIPAGTCDVAISGLTINPKRSRTVDFSIPYHSASQYLIVKKNDAVFTGTTKAELDGQLKNKKIGVCSGFTGEAYAKGDDEWEFEPIEGADVKVYDNISLAVTDLKNNSIDVIIMDDSVAMEASQTADNKDAVKVIQVPMTVEDYAIAIKKGNTELKEKIDKALQELIDAGEVEKIFNKWDV